MCNVNKEIDQMVDVTVLMTVYNGKEYLAEAVESILNQSLHNFEFIIVNEYGSDAETTNILKMYAKKDHRIVLIQNEKKMGFTASLNRGLGVARGKYIARMDPDDISKKNRLQIQYNFMEQNPDVMICGGNVRYLEGRKVTRHTQRYLKKADQIRMSTVFLCEFAHPTVMFNRKLFDIYHYGYNEKIKTEDYELWSRIVFQHDVKNIGKTLLFYRLHENNAIKVDKQIVKESTALVQKKIFESFGIDLDIPNGIIDGMETENQLEELEDALYRLVKENTDVFNSTFVFRNRMDVVYRNTEKKLGYSLNKYHRFWNKFNDLYNGKILWYSALDWIIYSMKDVLWKLIIGS